MGKLSSFKIDQEKGFTLVEVVVACSILAILLVPLSDAFFQAEQSGFINGNKTKALYFAQQEMEEAIASGKADGAGGCFGDSGDYQYAVSAAPEGRMLLVTVTVSYPALGSEKDVSLSTLVPAN